MRVCVLCAECSCVLSEQVWMCVCSKPLMKSACTPHCPLSKQIHPHTHSHTNIATHAPAADDLKGSSLHATLPTCTECSCACARMRMASIAVGTDRACTLRWGAPETEGRMVRTRARASSSCVCIVWCMSVSVCVNVCCEQCTAYVSVCDLSRIRRERERERGRVIKTKNRSLHTSKQQHTSTHIIYEVVQPSHDVWLLCLSPPHTSIGVWNQHVCSCCCDGSCAQLNACFPLC